MKLWCQSCSAAGREAVWAEYGHALVAHVRRVARPDTVVEVHGVSRTAPGIDRHHFAEHISTNA